MKILILTFLVTLSLLAKDTEVLKAKGYVSLDKVILKPGMKLRKSGLIKSGVGSFVKIKNNATQSIIILGPNSELQLDLTNKDLTQQNILRKGIARWVSEKSKDKDFQKQARGLRTTQAVMGVRGTDYIVKVTPLFKETEVIVMDGTILFASQLDTNDQKSVNKHQWGGIGGRYGKKIGDLLDLEPETIKFFDKIIPNI